jgi:acetylornithine/succinyldiaminopimelate/putrescine aminotransferase
MKNIYYKNIVNLYKTILNSFIYFYWLGEHGSTFGGYPLASNIASHMLEYLHDNNYEDIVNKKSIEMMNRINFMKNKYSFIKEIRNEGLLYGIEIDDKISTDDICNQLIYHGVIIKNTYKNTIRLLPPFIITNNEIDELFNGIFTVFDNINNIKNKIII